MQNQDCLAAINRLLPSIDRRKIDKLLAYHSRSTLPLRKLLETHNPYKLKQEDFTQKHSGLAALLSLLQQEHTNSLSTATKVLTSSLAHQHAKLTAAGYQCVAADLKGATNIAMELESKESELGQFCILDKGTRDECECIDQLTYVMGLLLKQ